MARSIVGAKSLQKKWEGPHWEGVWPCLDPCDIVRLRTSSSYWNVPGKYGPHSEFFFFPVRKESMALTKAVPCKPFVSTETLKACALVGLQLLVLTLETCGENGCPKSSDWDSDVESWTEGEGTSSSELCEYAVENTTLHVIGQIWSGEKESILLEDWELARMTWSCHIALDMLCQEMHVAR